MDDIDLVIFDSDGTLVDSEPILLRVMTDETVALGMPRERAPTFAEMEGQSMIGSLALFEGRLGRPLPLNFEEHVRACMAQVFRAELKEIPGALALLQALRVPFCVASNGPRHKIELVLGLTGMLPLVHERIFSAVDVGSYKPEPGLFLHAARTLGAQPQRCVVVEDSLAGIRAGLAAGMRTFAYRRGDTLPPDLRAQVTLLEHIGDLLQHVQPGAAPSAA